MSGFYFSRQEAGEKRQQQRHQRHLNGRRNARQKTNRDYFQQCENGAFFGGRRRGVGEVVIERNAHAGGSVTAGERGEGRYMMAPRG